MTESTIAAGRPAYWLNLPDGWLRLETTGERIPVQVQRLLDEAIAREPAAGAHRGQIERQLTSALRTARSRELAFAAMLATFTPNGLPIAASLTITVHKAPTGSDVSQILSGVGAGPDASARENSLFELPFVGNVVRSAFRDRVAIDDAARGEPTVADIAVWQYFIPEPSGRTVVVVTGATPTLPMTEVFGRLFDAVASTFQFVDDPTT